MRRHPYYDSEQRRRSVKTSTWVVLICLIAGLVLVVLASTARGQEIICRSAVQVPIEDVGPDGARTGYMQTRWIEHACNHGLQVRRLSTARVEWDLVPLEVNL